MPTPEEEKRLAEQLVTEATAPYAALLSADKLKEMREHLVDELLCTSYGRARLRRLLPREEVLQSDELPVDGSAEDSAAKERAGGS
jgi:hypothetical protein